MPTEKIVTESSLIFHSFFLPFAFSKTSQTYSNYELETSAVNLCKQFGDWSTDGREIGFYTSSFIMHTIYSKPLGGKEYCRIQCTANQLEVLIIGRLDMCTLLSILKFQRCSSCHIGRGSQTSQLAYHHM
jgi:hypothetical protein